jgi:hypothetical protein
MKAGLGGWKENSVGVILQAFVCAKNPDQFINFIIVRFDVLVTNWPVFTQTIYAFSSEIVGAKA